MSEQYLAAEDQLAETVTPGARPRVWKAIAARPMALGSAIFLVVIVLVAIFANVIAPYAADFAIPRNAFQGPQPGHLLGFDSAGRDVLSRLIYGASNTMAGAAIALAVSMAIGIPTGLVAGYYGGWFDSVSNWVTNLVMALPAMIILLASRAVLGPTVWALMIVLGFLVAPSFYRLVRGTVTGVRNELFVDAARVSGLSDARIIARHVLTAVRAPVIIQISLVAGAAIGLQAGLEYVGIGSGSIPTWGGMLNEAFLNFNRAPILLVWPALALGLTSAAFVLLAVGARDALDDRGAAPRTLSRREQRAAEVDAVDARAAIAPEGRGGLLSVRGLRVAYRQPDGGDTEVVHGVDIDVTPGQIVGLVGESGSGKSQTAFSALGILPAGGRVTGGSILIEGQEVIGAPAARARSLRRALAYVPQEPMSNLDPSFTIGAQLTEPLRVVLKMSKSAAKARIIELLGAVEIVDPERVFRAYPHEISGGMAQRVLIASALSINPKAIIADEPTTALDVTVQAEVLGVLRRLRDERGVGILLVTHSLGVVADLCDRVAVMQSGRIVEFGDAKQVLRTPQHPYTQQLLGAALDEDVTRGPYLAEKEIVS